MSSGNRITLAALLILWFLPQTILAEGENKTNKHRVGDEIHLSADLHRLLNEEMAAIEHGMKELIPAISSGDWKNVVSIAQNISDSFIMKQKLTVKQKEELHMALPDLFVEMDQDFHNSAAMLAHAAEMKNADVVNFYFFKLNNACVSCHTKFAKSRFPGLVNGRERDSHSH